MGQDRVVERDTGRGQVWYLLFSKNELLEQTSETAPSRITQKVFHKTQGSLFLVSKITNKENSLPIPS